MDNYISQTLKQETARRGLTIEKLARVLSQNWNMSYSYVKNFVDIVINMGLIYGTITSNPRNPGRALEKTSRLLYLIGIEGSHDVILGIRKINLNFKYSPDSETLRSNLFLEAKLIKLKPEHRRVVEQTIDDYLASYKK